MSAQTLSKERRTEKLIERIDPRVKLCWAAMLTIIAGLHENPLILAAVAAAALASNLLLSGTVKPFKIPAVLMAIVGVQLVIVQLIFNREGAPVTLLGFVHAYSGALPAALTGTLRAAAVVFACMQFLLWTPAEDGTLMLIALKVPCRYAMLVMLTVRFLPLMQREYLAVAECQRARGMPSDRLRDKIKALLPTFFPFLYRAVRGASDTALAMELRGFGRSDTRTFSKELKLTGADKAAMLAMAALLLVCAAQKLLPMTDKIF